MKRHPFLFILSAIFILVGLLLPFSQASAASSRGLAVPRNALPAELGQMDIKDYYAAAGTKGIGAIKSVVGHAVVFREDRRYAYFAAPGDRIFERDVVYTLKGSRCRVQLDTSDVATMGESTRLMIKTNLDNRQTKVKSTTFAMNRGKAMFYALRLMKYKGSSMEVETPTAVCGVRGTKWGMEVLELEGKPVASLPVQVAELSDAGFRYLAQANQPQFQTNVYSFEGSIQVTSTTTGQGTTLNTGQGLNVGGAGLGNPFPTPPGVASQFQAATSAPGGGGGTGTDGAGGGGAGTGPETGPGPGSNIPDTSGLTQQQNTQQQAQQENTQSQIPNRPAGFAKGMISFEDAWSYAWNTVQGYAWFNNFDSTDEYNNYSGPKMKVSGTYVFGTSGGQLQMTYLDVDTGPSTWVPITSGLPATISYSVLGSNPYAEWGYWTQSTPMTAAMSPGNVYYLNNKSYYIIGDGTGSNVSRAISGIYSGPAYGTLWTSSGGADMTGQFSASLDFSTRAISNFNLHVSGNSHTATMNGMSGRFGGSQDPGRFWIDSAWGGTWGLDGYGTKYAWVDGRMFGPAAETMGGIWSLMTDWSSIAASGVFAGTKTGTAITVPSVAMSPTMKQGYFTGISTYEFNSDTFVGYSYMSTSLQNIGSADARALKIDGSGNVFPSYFVKVDGTGPTPVIVELSFSGSPATNLPQPLQTTIVGQNAYMEWGSWMQPIAMTFGDPYYFDHAGWYIHGDATTDAQMAALKANGVNGAYYGPAYGTLLTGSPNPTATALSGTVSANVNFSSPAVTMFNLNLNSGMVKVEGATGTFNGSTSQFVINPATGNWYINNTQPATQKAANGSVYGSTGQAVGGTWVVGDSVSQKYASGIFQGMRSGTPK